MTISLSKSGIFMIMLAFLIQGCSNLKYLPEGEFLYTGGKVNIESDSISKNKEKALRIKLETLLRPRPNSTFLGLRPKLYFYNIAGTPKKEKGFKYWLKNKMGEPPVLFSQVDLEYNASLLQNYSENKGYFNAKTTADSTERNRKVTAEYNIDLGIQYLIKEITFPKDSSNLTAAINNTRTASFLKQGEAYDLDIIKAERERIDANLKEEGYYYFNPDYVLIQVDSTVGTHQVNLNVKLKEETPQKARQTYTINNIYIYADYSITEDTLSTTSAAATIYKDFTIVDPENKYKPQVFERSLRFKKGDLYNRTDHNKSLNRLVNLGTFKFVKNQFRTSDSLENTLDAYYYLTPLPKKSIRLELLGKTNSANYAGSEINLSWSNRNALRGAELLTIKGFGGFEIQASGQNQGYNIFKIGAEAALTWPKLLTPFNINSPSAFVPRTKATLSYEYQTRSQLYGLNSFKSSFGYLWKENIRKEHQLNVFDVTYVSPFSITDLYKEQIAENPSLGEVTQKQLIFGPTYSYTYTNTMETAKKSTFYYQGKADLAGNITGLVTGADIESGNPSEILGVAFSQYVKLESDFRHYFKLSNKSQLASRIMIGAGLPYGNSTKLPFIKQFSSGGTNSIRAFRARSIGPGSYNPEVESATFLPDQTGDLKLELNTELRTDLFSIVEGALFIDAGNVWLLNEDPEKPGAKLSKDFLKELAVGTGAGLRFDLSFLILRTDLAFPIRKPYLPDGNRWVLDKIDFGNRAWRKENLVFNLAIGYPF
ncbi:BamA/TamA family outer membrane protein [Gillisia sp. M10.2A]|uniref:BamA/TamA family outer membrane protein n=1 Tax=Gillisia lutea TaxID=2909668 RepID=A0ABS9EIT0_9FLAO|nr:BamA/TamA family outer membrane protein [Gillisia lutea]MCF4102731.1 BamA/TamA family outer membrane protein [Gillisia lutea]